MVRPFWVATLASRPLIVLACLVGLDALGGAVTQADGFERITSCDSLRNRETRSGDKASAIICIGDIALGAQLRGLEEQVRALDFGVRFDRIRRLCPHIAKGLRGGLTLGKKVPALHAPAVSVGRDLLLAHDLS